jgi:ABC-type maltose transport system permease subunit
LVDRRIERTIGPIIVLFFVAQRTFIEGIAVGGLKG